MARRWVYAGGAWSGPSSSLLEGASAPGALLSGQAEPCLSVEVVDGDIAVIDYRPAPEGCGRFYLGFQPRDYYDDPDESAPVDVQSEAEGFADWSLQLGSADIEAGHVRPLIAPEGVEEPRDTFVEETVEALVRLVGLPLPDGLDAVDLD